MRASQMAAVPLGKSVTAASSAVWAKSLVVTSIACLTGRSAVQINHTAALGRSVFRMVLNIIAGMPQVPPLKKRRQTASPKQRVFMTRGLLGN